MPELKLSTLIDRFVKQQDVVAEKARDVKRVEAIRDKEKLKLDKIGNEILDRFSKDDIHGYETAIAKAELKTIVSASLKDWTKLTDYVKKNNAFELFQRRVNKSAWLEHLEARKGKPVPGISEYQRVVLSVTKAKR